MEDNKVRTEVVCRTDVWQALADLLTTDIAEAAETSPNQPEPSVADRERSERDGYAVHGGMPSDCC